MKLFYRALLTQGKSIPWLAKKLGISHQTIYQWRLGRSQPKPKHVIQLAKILKTRLDDLVDDFY